ncbi:hypothetical protein GIB67_012146 [Kingdonia uniflora]|uniref:FHA domain-containing protein n=1 Tax=Kingdonia uniflora TaxID=39325 RepID=A0A7J7N9F7_9MAGN|nr:hypothetical protein GIB67_012146 [Kingdonia uniflora]
MEIHDCSKRQRGDVLVPVTTDKKQRLVVKTGSLYLNASSSTNSICLKSDRIYTIGRNRRYCHFLVEDPRVSERHCQVFLDSFQRKIFILDGFVLASTGDFNEIKRKFHNQEGLDVKASLNGVYVNGCRIREGKVVELCTGDEVSFVCADEMDQRIGFVVERVTFTEEVIGFNDRSSKSGYGAAYKDFRVYKPEGEDLIARSTCLLSQCRKILDNPDPISYIRGCVNLSRKRVSSRFENQLMVNKIVKIPLSNKHLCGEEPIRFCSLDGKQNLVDETSAKLIDVNSLRINKETVLNSEVNAGAVSPNDHFQQREHTVTSAKNIDGDCTAKKLSNVCSSSGKKFFLNRLDCMNSSSTKEHMAVSLPELLHPVETLSGMFIATFTSDVSWFLSYCEVPNNLPVTIACHNTERCWSSSPDNRTTAPYVEFPNLVVVYPPFPEEIAFGKDRKKHGIACHHPKLLVLQREDSIRVVVTSANLNSKQWNSVTNTVWWQDFPRRSEPDCLSLFTDLTNGEIIEGVKSDFAAQLAGFMASLITDVPSQAHWIMELTKYDFRGAVGNLVVSIPGMHMHKGSYPLESAYFLSAYHSSSRPTSMKFLGSVEASIVGLNHRFHCMADSNGAQLKILAAFLGKCRRNAFGMSEVVLRRNTSIPADANAVSVLIGDLDEFSEGDYIQLGFMPKDVAKWVAPLCDAGLFSFSGYIYPKEVLAAASVGNNSKVPMILYGHNLSEISRFLQPEHVASICSLVSSMQRCVGLWRLEENLTLLVFLIYKVLGHYKWPELLETDFVYGASSIGTSMNPQFLAAFSAAAGKRSVQFVDSEESDPEWGHWNTSHESKNPSLRIIFPTIDRVRDAPCGIWPSRRLLCFSEKAWQRLKSIDILHDAVPHPSCRVGYPMHVKVARRRFQSKTDASSFGWVYCGSHNFSPAAWGRPMTSGVKANGTMETTSSTGSRLHVCNYELGIILIVPPLDTHKGTNQSSSNLDDIILPFVLPAPKYKPNDRPATTTAMREALAKLAELEKEILEEADGAGEMMDEEMPDEEEVVEVNEYVAEEKEEENAYAEKLWSQVDSSESR